MAFHIKTTVSNGYRCSCCSRTWDNTDWADTLEEALEQVPIELVDGEPHPFNGDVEITEVSVIDGSTGDTVAWATARWSSGYEKYSGYNYTCWSGYRPDTGRFEAVYNRGGKKQDESWAEVTDRLREQRRLKDLQKAEKDLASAKSRIAALKAAD